MSICTVRESNWSICTKKYYAITIKHFFSERCTSTASKTETVTHDSKIFESGMFRKFAQLFINVPGVTVIVKGKWEPFFGFCTYQYIFVPNIVNLFYGDAARIRKNASLEMTTEYMLQYMLLFLRETKKHIKKKTLKPHQSILLT